MAKATGQITIIDYNDALTLTSFLSSNVVKTQMYNPDNGSYSPNWGASPFLVLTASLFKAGTATDIFTSSEVNNVKSVKYYEMVEGIKTEITATDTRVFSGTKNHILTIKSNEMASVDAKDYFCTIIYTDVSTGLDITQECSISFSKVKNGSGLQDAIANTPNGNIFRNPGNTDTLIGTIDLWRGSTIDTTGVAYQWYMQDSSVVDDEGAGIGWKRLTDTSGKYTGVRTNTITVYADAFTNIGVFKASVEDTDQTSPTRNTFFWDTVTFIDVTDPIAVTVTSTGGDVFKNGVGTSVLRAELYRGGSAVDSTGTEYTYKWYKYDKDGVLDPNFGDTGVSYRTGKEITVRDTDVNVKSTFKVEVE